MTVKTQASFFSSLNYLIQLIHLQIVIIYKFKNLHVILINHNINFPKWYTWWRIWYIRGGFRNILRKWVWGVLQWIIVSTLKINFPTERGWDVPTLGTRPRLANVHGFLYVPVPPRLSVVSISSGLVSALLGYMIPLGRTSFLWFSKLVVCTFWFIPNKSK